MEKLIRKIGYIGIIIFIFISSCDGYLHINDSLSSIIMIISFIMFAPMVIQEIRSLINK